MPFFPIIPACLLKKIQENGRPAWKEDGSRLLWRANAGAHWEVAATREPGGEWRAVRGFEARLQGRPRA